MGVLTYIAVDIVIIDELAVEHVLHTGLSLHRSYGVFMVDPRGEFYSHQRTADRCIIRRGEISQAHQEEAQWLVSGKALNLASPDSSCSLQVEAW